MLHKDLFSVNAPHFVVYSVLLFTLLPAAAIYGQSVTVSFQDGVNDYSGTRDAVLQFNSPATNYGSVVEGKLDGNPDEATLLFWDVTDIPIGSTVESVDITVNITNTSGAAYEIYDLKRAWMEHEATWNQYASLQSWQAAGADGAEDRGSTAYGALDGSTLGLSTISLNAAGVAAVQAWVNDPSSNHGFIVQDYTHNNGVDFSSREAAVASQRPKLTVTYTSSAGSVFSIDDVSVVEGNDGPVEADFTVTLSPSSTQAVTVDYATSDSTASAGSDYFAVSGQMSFAPGETSRSVSVHVKGDALDEANEMFLVALNNAVNAGIADSLGQGTIIDDDVIASFQDGVNGYSGTRDAILKANSPATNYGSVREAKLDGNPDESTLLFWDVTDMPIGSTVESVEITVNITNTSGAAYEIYEVKRAWMEHEATWNQYASMQNWQAAGADGAEDRGSTAFGALDGSALGLSTISLNAAGVAAVQSWVNDPSSNHGFIVQDYTHNNGVDFSSREAAVASQRPKLTVTYTSGGGSVLSIDDVSVVEGNDGPVEADFTVTLSPSSTQTVTVDYATNDSTASAGSDYVSASGQLSFAPGATSQSVTVQVSGDALDEADETFLVELSNAVGAGIADSQGQGTITDDDPTPSLSINDVTADEDAGTMSFTASLSAISGRDVSVDYMTADDTAIAPDDYTAASGTLIIPAGSGSGTVTFGNIGDYGNGSEAEANVASMLLALNPDFITTNGDNNYPDGEEATWAENVLQFYSSYVDAVDVNANRFFASLGNHDYHVFPSAFLDGLALPEGQGNERYYDFVKGPIHFFVLDSNSEQPDGRTSDSIQGQWLQARLAESTSPWNIVYMHHAPWSSSLKHGDSSTMQWPYDAWGADAVFAGHDHIYERISKDEDGDGEPILYFVNGLGGASIYELGSPIPGSEVRYNDDFGAMFVSAHSDSIVYEFHSVSEGLVDRFVVTGAGGSSSSTLAVNLIDDAASENTETFTVVLSNPVNATLSDNQGTGSITDDDSSVSISFQDGVNGYSGTRDAVLQFNSPATNYGSVVEGKLDGNPDEATLLFWDVTDVPIGSTVDSVAITVNITNTSGAAYEIYDLKRAWVEHEATWNQYASLQSWQAAGANVAEDRGSTAFGALDGSALGLSTISLNAAGVAAVQAWVNDPSSNHGFIVQDYTHNNGVDFSSRETATIPNRPMLTVTYRFLK